MMLISELIKELQDHKTAFGDQPVVGYYDCEIYNIEGVSGDEHDVYACLSLLRIVEGDLDDI